ncbi:4997_t:CDS:2, partial [Scutellospora calospora]
QKQNGSRPSEESAREIVWKNFLSLQKNSNWIIANNEGKELDINEWNQIAQNPQKYGSKLNTEQVQYIQSCYKQLDEGENQDFQEFVTDIFIILTNIWERKDLDEGMWEALFMTPFIELFKQNQNAGRRKTTKGEKGLESPSLRKQLQKQQEKENYNIADSRAESWHTVNNPQDSDDEKVYVLLQSKKSDVNKESDTSKIPKILLSKNKLEVTKMKNVNQQAYSQSVIKSIAFHPNAQIAMTAGLDKTMRLFQVDGKINPKIQSAVLKDLPIYQQRSIQMEQKLLPPVKKKYFYIFNIETGIIDKSNVLVSNKTKQWASNMKMNGTVDWSSDCRYLYSVGGDTNGMLVCEDVFIGLGMMEDSNLQRYHYQKMENILLSLLAVSGHVQ